MEVESSGGLNPPPPPRNAPSADAAGRQAPSRACPWLVTAALAVPACVSYAPEPLEPGVELARLLERPQQDLRVEPAGPWQAEWFPLTAEVHVDDGVSLAEANALALFYSPEIRRARAEASIAGALVLQAGVLSNPELFLGPRISTEDSSLIFPAGIGWDLPVWGEESAERAVAETKLGEELLAVVEIELRTLEQVRAHFLRLDRLQGQERVLEAAAASSRQIVAWIEALAEAGESDSVAVFLGRSERDAAAAALEQLRAEARQVHRRLLALLGLLPEARVRFAAAAAVASLPALPGPDREALLAVPALRAAEAGYATAEARLKHEIAKQYPAIQFGPQLEDDAGNLSIGVGLQFDLPLFDRNRGGIAAAAEARQQARERYREALLRSAHDEAEARDALAAAESLLQVHRDGALRDAEDARESLDVRLRTGSAEVLEVLAAQGAIAGARARALELEEQIAVARLRAAVAGGFATGRPAPPATEERDR